MPELQRTLRRRQPDCPRLRPHRGDRLMAAKPKLFELGRIAWTPGVANLIPRPEALAYFWRHRSGDYGTVPREDKLANSWAIANGERIVSRYDYNGTRLLLITEADRSVSTLMLGSEY